MSHKILTSYGRILLSKWFHVIAIILLSLVIFYDQKHTIDHKGIDKAIEHLFAHNDKTVSGVIGSDYRQVQHFYENRDYSPLWLIEGKFTSEARYIYDLISDAEKEGLSSSDYTLDLINLKSQKRVKLAKSDIYLTFNFARFLVHLRNGRIDESIADTLWPKHPEYIDAYRWLEQHSDTQRIVASLFKQTPPHVQYERLRKALAKLVAIKEKGGWPRLPLVSLLKPGLKDSRVTMLKKRLIISGDLDKQHARGDFYNEEVRKAVASFQTRHGILSDGLAGIETIKAMNVSVSQRMQQIQINMERWRLMQRNLGTRHILVNSAGFELIAMDDKNIDLQMRVIVGETDLATPVFSAPITKITINPEWHVPRSISATELLEKVKENVDYLDENDFVVFRVGSDNRRTIFNPTDVDWSELHEDYFPYEIVKKAGPKNPLGRVKFFIPNFHSIYLHDTHQRHLFDHVFRNLSHGCIRLEKPKSLMRYLLKYDSIWRNESINSAWDSDDTRTIELKNRVPVHILYFTTWIDDNGTMNFYPDVYSYDQRIEALLM